MPYSPNLRIELITNGTQAGVWGTTTNTNLGTLIEGAIAGYTTVSVTSANQAFTALDGAADQSRNAMIRLTTTTTAAFAVYAPPSPKEYTVYNNTAYVATIYNSTVIGNTTAAGAGVAIPAGAVMTVWSTGTIFLQQNTHLISPTLTGTPVAPTAASTTNTTQIATTAFVQAIAVLTFNAIYPVGSIYTNANNATNPGTLLGIGTWVAFGGGLVPVGFLSGSPLPFGTGGGMGGSADSVVVTHTHTAITTLASTTHTHSGTTAGAGSHTHNLSSAVSFNENNDSDPPMNSITGDNGTATLAPTATLQAINLLTTAPDHVHTITTGNNSVTPTASTTNTATGVSGTNQNYQPYITVYMWKRTA
jgi:hypothetical protein